jgi:hypothetical protein
VRPTTPAEKLTHICELISAELRDDAARGAIFRAICLVAARLAAPLVRSRRDSRPENLEQLPCKRWEVILPELVFTPETPEA